MKICIVVSNYYKIISENLLKGSISELKRNNYQNIKIKYVSGTFEIPNMISKNINKFDAFIAIGCVIKGKTDHYYFISQAVTSGLMNLSIQSKKPIARLRNASLHEFIRGKNLVLSFRQFVEKAFPVRLFQDTRIQNDQIPDIRLRTDQPANSLAKTNDCRR